MIFNVDNSRRRGCGNGGRPVFGRPRFPQPAFPFPPIGMGTERNGNCDHRDRENNSFPIWNDVRITGAKSLRNDTYIEEAVTTTNR